jgi:hypothetical protein
MSSSENTSILIDDIDMPQERNREQCRDCVAGAVLRLVRERHARVHEAARARHRIDRSRCDAGFPQELHDARFDDDTALMRVLRLGKTPRAMQHGLMQGILAHGDRGDVVDRIDMHRPVIAEELAIGAFRLGIAGLVEITFDDDLGIRRHEESVRHRAHHRQRRAADGPDQIELVERRHAHACGHEVERMRADREVYGQVLAARDRLHEYAAQVRHLCEIRAHGRARAQHQPSAADIAPPIDRIDRIVDRGGNVGRAVVLVLHMEREPGEVDGLAGENHLLHGRLALRNLKRFLRILHPAGVLGGERAHITKAESCRQATAAAANSADDLESLRPGILEQGRLRRRFDHGTDIGQVDRLSVGLDLAQFLQMIDKAPEPKLLHVRARNRSHRQSLFPCPLVRPLAPCITVGNISDKRVCNPDNLPLDHVPFRGKLNVV